MNFLRERVKDYTCLKAITHLIHRTGGLRHLIIKGKFLLEEKDLDSLGTLQLKYTVSFKILSGDKCRRDIEVTKIVDFHKDLFFMCFNNEMYHVEDLCVSYLQKLIQDILSDSSIPEELEVVDNQTFEKLKKTVAKELSDNYEFLEDIFK